MIDEVILRYFYAQLVRFLCPYMDNKRQPRAAKPILGSLRWLQKREPPLRNWIKLKHHVV